MASRSPSRNSLFKRLRRHHEGEIISDLDELLVREVDFRWNGKIYSISPLSMEEFTIFSNALARLELLKQGKIKSEDELARAYGDIFEAIVRPKIGYAQVKKMHYSQVVALYTKIIECVMGKTQVDYEKKSLKMANNPQEARITH